MEGEVYNFICVWMAILVSLFFCHTIGKNIPQGTTRFLALIPIISLFFYLPLNLTTTYLGGLTSFFIAWLANFKLLLFAFGDGPLSNPSTGLPIQLSQFVPTACLPIKILNKPSPSNLEKVANIEIKGNPSCKNSEKPSNLGFQEYPSPQKLPEQIPKKVHKSLLNYATKIVLFCILIMAYGEDINQYLRMFFYCFHLYFMLEIELAMLATLAKTLMRVELEPQFDEPYLATSLQDFWGKRWNLMVSSILRTTVFYPVKSISTRLMIPKKWAQLVAVFATFLVSGLMHELMFYYIGRLKPTGEITWYFMIQGVAVGIEGVIKRALDGKFRLHPNVSRLLVWVFVFASSFWLFFPPLLRFNPELRGCKETVAFLKFVRHGKLISPYDVSCPFDV